jgi:hypothetical protein
MLPRIVSGLAENTNSIFCDGPRARYSEWMSGSDGRNHSREAYMRAGSSVASFLRAPQKARVERRVFSLDKRLTWTSATRRELDPICPRNANPGHLAVKTRISPCG